MSVDYIETVNIKTGEIRNRTSTPLSYSATTPQVPIQRQMASDDEIGLIHLDASVEWWSSSADMLENEACREGRNKMFPQNNLNQKKFNTKGIFNNARNRFNKKSCH